MNVWTVSIFDGRQEPLVAIYSTEEKANAHRDRMVAEEFPDEWASVDPFWAGKRLEEARRRYREGIDVDQWEVDENA